MCHKPDYQKKERQKSFYKLQNNPNSLKTDPTENTFNKREREKKKSSLSPEKVPTKMEKKYQTFFVTSK